MTNLEQAIEILEAELAQMKQELEDSKKFKWDYPKGTASFVGYESVYQKHDGIGISMKWFNHGRYRLSEANAEYSLERNRLANRLEALAEQIEPDYVVPDMGAYTYTVYFYENKYSYSPSNYNSRYVGQVYMSRETAIKVCELLNSGEVVL